MYEWKANRNIRMKEWKIEGVNTWTVKGVNDLSVKKTDINKTKNTLETGIDFQILKVFM